MATLTGTPTAATGNTTTVFAGTRTWTNPTNIETNVSNATVSFLAGGSTSDDLIATGFGFGVPLTSTINGFTVVESDTSSVGTVTLKGMKMLKAGVAVGTSKLTGTGNNWAAGVQGDTTYGSGSDLWGTTWVPSDVNDTNFGVVQATTGASDTAGTRNLRVTVTFTTPAPTVTSCSPNNGTTAGGTSVTITGTNFFSGTITATFGGTAATSVTFVNSTTITCVTPAHAAGLVNVVVTNPDGQTGTGTNVYTYNAPAGNTSSFFMMF